MVVGYERTFEFFLPAESRPALQADLPAFLFDKAVAPFQAVQAAPDDKMTPRWMARIAGKALQSAEEEAKKRKEHHHGEA